MLSLGSIVVLKVLVPSGGVVAGMHRVVRILNKTPIEINKVTLNIVPLDISVLDIVLNPADIMYFFVYYSKVLQYLE